MLSNYATCVERNSECTFANRDCVGEALKVAPQIGLSAKCGHTMLLVLWFGMCVGGTGGNGVVNRSLIKFLYAYR